MCAKLKHGSKPANDNIFTMRSSVLRIDNRSHLRCPDAGKRYGGGTYYLSVGPDEQDEQAQCSHLRLDSEEVQD